VDPATSPRRPSPKRRRTQQERTAETRARLLDATLECLVELGYARTTTTEIAARAGVSRGAQLHHFPTKASLVATAVEHLFERRHSEFREGMQTLPRDANRGDAAIELLHAMVSGPTFHAWLELVVAARTDPEVMAAVTATQARFGETVRSTFADLFPALAERAEEATGLVFALLEGVALQEIVAPEPGRGARLVGPFRSLLSGIQSQLSVAETPTPTG
jgi:AcrR family transcriptional regulator